MEKTVRKGGANVDKMNVRTKTFVFEIEDAEDGIADCEVNDFCDSVRAVSMVLDRYNSKLLYRIIYKVEYEEI